MNLKNIFSSVPVQIFLAILFLLLSFFIIDTYVTASTSNLIANPSFETANGSTPENWLQGSWGALNASFIYPVPGVDGADAARVQIHGYSNGDAKWYFKTVPVTPGKVYTVSHSYMSNVRSEILARYTLSSGAYMYQFITTLPPASTWTKTTQEIVIPPNVTAATVFHSIYAVGTLDVDNYSLYEKVPLATSIATTSPMVTASSTPTATTTTQVTTDPLLNVAALGAAKKNNPPTASVSSPAGGSTISGTTTITVNASDDSGVSGVTLLIDGTAVLSEDTSAPYSFSWNSASVTNGPHTIGARARDQAGSTGTAANVSVSVQNQTTVPSGNLIRNPSFEIAGVSGNPDGWFRGSWGTHAATYTYPSLGADGSKAAKVEITSYTSGDAKWFFENVRVTPGKTYTITHSYKSTAQTEILARFKLANGSYRYQFMKLVPSATSWSTLTSEITIPSDSSDFSLFHVIYSVGTLEVDDFVMMEKGQSAPVVPPVTATTTPPTATTTPPTQPPATTTPTTTAPITKTKMLWGATTGWREEDIRAFETKVVENFDLFAVFVHWGNNKDFPAHYAQYAKDKGRTLIIFWEATDYLIGGANQPKYSYDAILRGDFDAYIRTFATQAKNYGGPVILIPFSEMNGNWFPWGGVVNGNTPAKGAAAYRHVRNVFGNVANVKFGWAPNSNSVPDTAENRMELYYPGDAYVDYVGVDGFNFGNPWLSFEQVFGDTLRRLSVYKKPIYLFSVATAPGPQKAAWMQDMFEAQIPKYPLLVGWSWFNENKERDWRLWSDDASFQVFQKAISTYE